MTEICLTPDEARALAELLRRVAKSIASTRGDRRLAKVAHKILAAGKRDSYKFTVLKPAI